ncbi:TetR/AcrR family transcriptional regulator [Yinghuangia sp. YIM S10712]|uniref:TetR/AcrR family transcriptional regulator n=1 Tax=Yinghuangia sp. YIM S10712 TaxID=3436930 RepID=UPI003F52C242
MTVSPPAGTKGARTRETLLDAATRLMLEEGYTAVSTRKVAAKAGVNHALVYYYFQTMDELLLAVFRRGAETNIRRLERALAADNPLRGLWEVVSAPHDSALTVEFMALANHREVIREELATYSRRFRRVQQDALADILRAYGIDTGGLSPAALTVLIGGLPRILAMDDTLGLTDGHEEVLALIETYLARFDRAPAARDDASGAGDAPASD